MQQHRRKRKREAAAVATSSTRPIGGRANADPPPRSEKRRTGEDEREGIENKRPSVRPSVRPTSLVFHPPLALLPPQWLLKIATVRTYERVPM